MGFALVLFELDHEVAATAFAPTAKTNDVPPAKIGARQFDYGASTDLRRCIHTHWDDRAVFTGTTCDVYEIEVNRPTLNTQRADQAVVITLGLKLNRGHS